MKTEKQRKIIIKELEKNGLISYACRKAGVVRATYYRWTKSDKQFAKLAKEALENGILEINDLGCGQLIIKIRSGDLPANKYWLSHMHPAFSPKLQLLEQIKRLRVDDQKADKSKLGPKERELIRKAIELNYGSSCCEKKEDNKTIRIHKILTYNTS